MSLRRFSRISILVACLACLATPSRTENLPFQLLHQKNGAAQEAFGYAVAGAGDVNGDGFDDFIVGNYRASPNGLGQAGSAYIYSGAGGSLLFQIDGSQEFEWLGFAVAGAGDVDRDGAGDILLGAPQADSGGLSTRGKVCLISGATHQVLGAVFGEAAGDQLGSSVGPTGDLDGDGKDDFLAGAPGAKPNGQPNTGSAYIFSSATGRQIFRVSGSAKDDFFGMSVAGAGDFDRDGTPDFIVGAPFADPDTVNRRVNSGAAYVYSGLGGTLLFVVRGDSADEYLGFSVAGAGDLNADGWSDVIIGAPNPNGPSDAGRALAFSGANRSLLFVLTGDSVGDLFGWSVAGAGDVNGDGFGDLLVGAIGADPDGFDYAGAAYVISGADGSSMFQIKGASPLDEMGYAVAGAGDVNGDGRPDVIAGAPLAHSDSGEVLVYGLVSTAVAEQGKNLSVRFELSQNYPNPFNPPTTVRYFLPSRQRVNLEIFNLLGERVRILTDEEQTAGEHAVSWDGKDRSGKALPSGIYFYRLRGKDFSETKKMLLLK